MKLMRIALVVGLVMLASCGCGDPGNGEPTPELTELSVIRVGKVGFGGAIYRHIVVDGVECIVYEGYMSGGISCEWN